MSTQAPSGLTTGEYLKLAFACLEEAGVTAHALKEIEDTLEDDRKFVCDRCDGAGCGVCDDGARGDRYFDPDYDDAEADEPESAEAW